MSISVTRPFPSMLTALGMLLVKFKSCVKLRIQSRSMLPSNSVPSAKVIRVVDSMVASRGSRSVLDGLRPSTPISMLTGGRTAASTGSVLAKEVILRNSAVSSVSPNASARSLLPVTASEAVLLELKLLCSLTSTAVPSERDAVAVAHPW